MEITSGVLKRPQKVVVYGPEGIGKSTFASHFPDPLFLDIEDSTSQLDVKRIQGINSWEMLLSLISQINRERPCKAVVVDTADWAEKLCIQHVCAVNKKGSIEDFGYGSGYVKLLEEFDAEGIFINSDNNITVTDGLKDRFTRTSRDYTLVS